MVVAGTGGDSGKTLVTLSLLTALRRRGLRPAAFKKGPDFIDAAWLGWAAGVPARNLDSFLTGWEGVAASFACGARDAGVSVIEGNRGYVDGVDAAGTHSTAALARSLDAPVLLVLPVRKITGTAAVFVAGCRSLAPDVRIAGVVLNRVAGERHGRVAREAVEALGVRVMGELPVLEGGGPIPDRHLGLVTPSEHGRLETAGQELNDIAARYLDVDAILAAARMAPPIEAGQPASGEEPDPGVRPTIGVFRDSAFTFYYPDNLEALEREGARLVDVSALEDKALPDVDALIIGGGFPETHAARLGGNASLRESVRAAAEDGLPVYAECGGLMYLSRSITWGGATYPMAGVIEADTIMHGRPVGHGYAEAVVDSGNPFFDRGTVVRGHEFHYSSIMGEGAALSTAYALSRGTGALPGRDGITRLSVLASYIHIHARGFPGWAPGIVRAARRFHERGNKEQ